MSGTPGLHFDIFSFLIGVILTLFVLIIVRKNQSVFLSIWHTLLAQLEPFRDLFQNNLDTVYRKGIIEYCQHKHIASAFFPLDDILIPPRIIPLPPPFDPTHLAEIDDITISNIAVCPDFPEMAGAYGVPSFSLAEALINGANLILMGKLGIGKTTALLDLAMKLARYQCDIKEFQSVLPLYIPLDEIHLENLDIENPLQSLAASVANIYSSKVRNKIPRFVHRLAAENKLVLLIDGLDELPPASMDRFMPFVQKLVQKYPHCSVIAACSTMYIGDLSRQGFLPVMMKSWNKQDATLFLKKWSLAWNQDDSSKQQSLPEDTSTLRNAWLTQEYQHLTPLEWTLIALCAYNNLPISQYNIHNLFWGLSALGIEYPPSSELSRWALTNLLSPDKPNPYPGINTVNLVTASRLTGEVKLFHSFIQCLLAAYILDPKSEDFYELMKMKWAPANETSKLAIAIKNIFPPFSPNEFSELYQSVLDQADSLHYADPKSTNAKNLLRQVASLIISQPLTLQLKTKLITSLLKSPFEDVGQFLGYLLKSSDPLLRTLGALGCGLHREIQIEPLVNLLQDPVPSCYQSACLALVSIGTPSAIDAVTTVLVHGHERLQIAAAQALANDLLLGQPILREAVKENDVLVRKAVIHGLSRINQEWALKLLESVAVNDEQWVIKDAAAAIINQRSNKQASLPQPIPEPANLPWLIQYASIRGIGLAPGRKHYDIIISAIEEGEPSTQLAAIDYLRYYPVKESTPTLLKYLKSNNPELKEAAYQALWFFQRVSTQ
jgi:HEAT repeat protein